MADENSLKELKKKASQHRIFEKIVTPALIRTYMEYQVWCVWDFMVIVKSIQRDLQAQSSAWLPSPNPVALRYINTILMDEETDEIGSFTGSHFELYLAAMQMAGVSLTPITRFCDALRAGTEPLTALRQAQAPECARRFVEATLEISKYSLEERAAVLLHSREDLVPRLLKNLLSPALSLDPGLNGFREYAERHVYLDTKKHAEISEKLFSLLTTTETRNRALSSAISAIQSRIIFLDGIAIDMRI